MSIGSDGLLLLSHTGYRVVVHFYEPGRRQISQVVGSDAGHLLDRVHGRDGALHTKALLEVEMQVLGAAFEAAPTIDGEWGIDGAFPGEACLVKLGLLLQETAQGLRGRYDHILEVAQVGYGPAPVHCGIVCLVFWAVGAAFQAGAV